jgi:benzoyl-CoA reductase subunit C
MKEELKALRQERHNSAVKWKEQTGGKIVGVFCCNVPEELIYAAGMLPVRILGEHEEATEGNLHFPTNVCPYPVSCLDQALKGRYDYLDGLVVPNVCDMIRSMYGTWKLNLKIPYVHFLEVPQRISREGSKFFHESLIKFKDSLETFSGREITAESLARAIHVYNRNRALLGQAAELRKEGFISGTELQGMVMASMLMPKINMNELLNRYLEEAGKRQPNRDGVRIFVSASMLDDTDFFELIEDCGGSVVADDMPMGSRYFSFPVEDANDPFAALAERYLMRIACPRKMLPEDRKRFIENILDGVEVDGAIIHNLKACDCHLYEYPFLKKTLEAKGLPVLFFRGEETETEMETQRDDIEAFVEMLRG